MNLPQIFFRLERKYMIKVAIVAAILIIFLVWILSDFDEPVTTDAHELATDPSVESKVTESHSPISSIPPSPNEPMTPSVPPGLSISPHPRQTSSIDVAGLDCLIEPHLTVEVATTASGIVKEIRVDRGSLVQSGQVLANLESEVEKANVAHARARVDFATKKLKRMKELYKEQMVSLQQLDEAQAEYDLALAELQKAMELLKQRTIESPLSGVVVERFVSPGELVENKKIVKVAQVNPLNVEIIAPVSMLGGFKTGAKVLVYPEGPVPGPLEASIRLVDRVIDAPSGTFRVRLDLPNRKFAIPAGIRCRAQLAPPEMQSPVGGRPVASGKSRTAAKTLTPTSPMPSPSTMMQRDPTPVPTDEKSAASPQVPNESDKLGPTLERESPPAPSIQTIPGG